MCFLFFFDIFDKITQRKRFAGSFVSQKMMILFHPDIR